ncbi:N-acyl-L-amino acid amidohydrolase [Haloprofundus marisrubri]|uniref:N-acyl-L-amino acid amidohydrolase n=1 Tax=Haloprofundus marisrubri TaxID=1514971 RepID=A0A0W1RAB4_9EURY|nr:amidohydrolase [Haloprofundus marisrubri]KTG10396.1 N-acyl-L-amino acid amidohydrolase [Haloprofundus marisrubri]
MSDESARNRLRTLRRQFHRYPEPAWCEYYTTSRIVDEVERIGVDRLYIGTEAYASEHRMALPDSATLREWHDRAADAGARSDVLELTEDGHTGAIAVLEKGTDGPTVVLRVDIDALPQREANDSEHVPSVEGFRSTNDGVMHACGHDAHITTGLGVLEAVSRSDEFDGTFTLIFQPAEERAGGGKPMALSRHTDDVDYFLGLHVGLGHPTGSVVGGIVKPLAVTNFEARFRGESAHAGKNPSQGRNAMQAASTAVQNVYSIPRHVDGMTRINVGRIDGGTAPNIVAEEVRIEGEIRGETNEILQFLRAETERVVDTAAEMHSCDSEFEVTGEAPRADSDPEFSRTVADVAREHGAVTDVTETSEFGASEDATYLMKAVEEQGGTASYAIIGTDHPAPHHSSRFDVDERSLGIGVEVLSETVTALSSRQ